MSILLDHCVPRRYHRLLGDWGYQAELSTQYIQADAPDSAVITLAQSLDAVLLTIDLDFANILNYPPSNYGGIIVLRYQIDEEINLDRSLQKALADLYRDDLRKALIIISPERYRLRR